MIHYIIQTIAFQLFFLIVYDVFLKKETFFNWNRVYLLGTATLSIVLPFIKIESFKDVVPQQYVFSFPKLALETQNPIVLDEVVLQGTNMSHPILWYINTVLIIGCLLALCYFLYRMMQVFKLVHSNPKIKESNIRIVQMLNSTAAFSFFNYVFLGEKIDVNERESILKHELVHIEQKHTLDLLFFELLRVVFWFNPLVYMYQDRMSDLHEFIADSKAVKHNKKQYYENLLSQVFDTKSVSFINPFFKQSLIKKRIIMLQKSKSKQIQLIKYMLLIPMVLGMLMYSSCTENDTSNDVVEQEMTVSDKIEDLKMSIEQNGNLTEEEQEALLKLWIQSKGNKNAQLNSDIPNAKIITEEIDKDYSNSEEVPFAVIDHVPVFPGCESAASEDEKRKCMNINVNKFIADNFNVKLANKLGLSGTQKISVFFKISADGKVRDIKSRAPHPELEAETVRVISMLPTMIPGEQGGKKVRVPYYVPIKFQINE